MTDFHYYNRPNFPGLNSSFKASRVFSYTKHDNLIHILSWFSKECLEYKSLDFKNIDFKNISLKSFIKTLDLSEDLYNLPVHSSIDRYLTDLSTVKIVSYFDKLLCLSIYFFLRVKLGDNIQTLPVGSTKTKNCFAIDTTSIAYYRPYDSLDKVIIKNLYLALLKEHKGSFNKYVIFIPHLFVPKTLLYKRHVFGIQNLIAFNKTFQSL